ncbi:MAG: hypothetical protein ACYC99_13930 [Candidatus Geothermincolia bacterium]
MTETTVRKQLLDFLEEGEQIEAVARGTDLLDRPHYAGKTDRRGILLKLSKSYEVKGKEIIPLGKLDKKLRRLALGKGLIMSPPGEPAFKNDKERGLYEASSETLKKRLEEGESVLTMGMARHPDLKDPKYYYLAFTDKRFVMAKLSGNRDIYLVDGVPLDELESFELRHGDDPIPIDIPLFMGQEERLYVRYKDGSERTFLVTDLFGHRREDAPD